MIEMMRPRPGCLQQRTGAVAAIERAVEAGIDLLAPIFRRAFAEALAEHQAGVVDEDIQPAEVALDARDHLLDHVSVRDVGLVGFRLAAGLLDLGDDRLGLGLRAVIVDGNARARSGQRLADRGADIASAARHERDASLEIDHRNFLLI